MPGRKFSADGSYRYGFNGKENDNDVKGEGNQQDYGMRIYDPRLGRFLSVDPITASYPELTPYQFASNSPIENLDLDGLEGYSYNGTYIVHDNIPRVASAGVIDLNTHKAATPVQSDKEKQLQMKAFGEALARRQLYAPTKPPPVIQSTFHAEVNAIKANDARREERAEAIKPKNILNKLNKAAVDFVEAPFREFDEMKTAFNKGNLGDALSHGKNFVLSVAPYGGGFIKFGRLASIEEGFAYRALNTADYSSYRAGLGVFAKNPNGVWTVEEHLIHGSDKLSFLNDPWIATTPRLHVAEAFNSGNGIIMIDLSKVSEVQKGWLTLPRSSAGYHYSIWQQEHTVFGHIPQEAIIKRIP